MSPIVQSILTFLGGGAAILGAAYALFKHMGSKWLEAKFAERLQNLKSAQDRSIRHVQSSIDREIHRAKKLYDNEFMALSEGWRLLRPAYDASVGTITSWTVAVDKFTPEELDRYLTKRGMEEWDRKDLAKREGKDLLTTFHRWAEFERARENQKMWRESRTHLDTNCIFFPPGFAEKIRAVSDLIVASNIEFEDRARNHGSPADRVGFDATIKLRTTGGPLMEELEQLVRERLWSAAKIAE